MEMENGKKEVPNLSLFTTFQLNSILRLETSTVMAVRDIMRRSLLSKNIHLSRDFWPF